MAYSSYQMRKKKKKKKESFDGNRNHFKTRRIFQIQSVNEKTLIENSMASPLVCSVAPVPPLLLFTALTWR